MMKKILPFMSLFLFGFQAYCFENSNIENNIVQAANSQIPTALKQLETTVNINSGTMNFAGVKRVGMYFKSEYDKLGFETTWHEGQAFNRAGHLVASYGDRGKKFLLIGHLDTVFAKDDNFQEYKKIDSRFASGPGVTDMKGGNVIILAAVQALKEAGALNNMQIKVVLTGDEEKSGRPLSLSKKALIDAGKWADIALGFEDGDSDIKTAVIARRGAISWQLNVTGKPAHSSQMFRQDIGDGAIFEIARILNAFREALAKEPNLTFNPGVIAGGTEVELTPSTSRGTVFGKDNVIAKSAVAMGDIRALSPEQEQHAKKTMRSIVKQHLSHTSSSIVFHDGYPAMPPSQGNKALLSMYSQVSEDLGFGSVVAVNPRKAGAADISFVAEHVDMALDGLGLMGSGGHTRDEIADITSLKKNIQKAAVLMHRLSLSQ